MQLIDFLSQNPLLCTTHVDNFESTPAPFAIDIYIKSIGNDDVNAVNARELWAKLEVKTDFSDWIKGRIDKYEFLQDVDFISLKNKVNDYNGLEVVKSIDYFISLDMAKELSMVENNDQGKSARRYFIECEKQAKTITPKLESSRRPKPTPRRYRKPKKHLLIIP